MPAARQRVTEIVIGSEIGQLARVRDALDRLGRQHGMAEQRLADLLVAVDELLSNIVKYAWADQSGGGQADHRIAVRIVPGLEQIELEVADDGRPFDPLTARPPAPPAPGERPRPGGVGLHMLKKLVDEIYYQRNEGRNRTRLTKRYG
jgi:anti-sigma regulatory factor (Ser/Thr protein kinase)